MINLKERRSDLQMVVEIWERKELSLVLYRLNNSSHSSTTIITNWLESKMLRDMERHH